MHDLNLVQAQNLIKFRFRNRITEDIYQQPKKYNIVVDNKCMQYTRLTFIIIKKIYIDNNLFRLQISLLFISVHNIMDTFVMSTVRSEVCYNSFKQPFIFRKNTTVWKRERKSLISSINHPISTFCFISHPSQIRLDARLLSPNSTFYSSIHNTNLSTFSHFSVYFHLFTHLIHNKEEKVGPCGRK